MQGDFAIHKPLRESRGSLVGRGSMSIETTRRLEPFQNRPALYVASRIGSGGMVA